MSPVQHRITGPALSFSLHDEMKIVRSELTAGRERMGRTLIKDGALRVTLVGIAAGGTLPEHTAAGPVTIHVLEGALEIEAAGKTWPLAAGMVLALDHAVPHSVRSASGAMLLLTVMHAEAP